MEIQDTGLSKTVRSVIHDVDGFIEYFKKAKGSKPECIHLKPKDYDAIKKGLKSDAEKLTRKGVLLCRK